MDRDPRTRLFIDVGTNCEIVLGNEERLIATAAPAGPAFEGGAIRCGMRAATGAIEGVSLNERVMLKVIGDAPPAGLCGSGLVDAVAELVRAGLIDPTGRFVADEDAALAAPALAGHLGWRGQERVFVLAAPTGSRRGPDDQTPDVGRRSPGLSTSPSATSANCSSPRPPSLLDGASCLRRRG